MEGFLSLAMESEFVTYVLYSKAYDKIYIGCTSQLIQRFYSHNSLSKKGYTKRYRPWKVVLVQFFTSKKEAMNRENELKSSRGRDYIRKQILKQ